MKNTVIVPIFYFTLFLSYMNTVFRLDEQSSISLFRVFLPFMIFLLIIKYREIVLKNYIYYLLFFLYSLIQTYFYNNIYEYFFVFIIHAFILLNLFLITKYICSRIEFKFIKFQFYFFVIIVVVAITQILFHFNLPNTNIPKDMSVSAMFWTQNELSTALLSFVPFLLVYGRLFINIIFVPMVLFITYYNDSKMAFLSIILGVLIYFIFVVFQKKFSYVVKFLFTIIIFYIFFILFLIFDINAEIFIFNSNTYSFFSLLMLPLEHILLLDPFPGSGSIPDRTNAVIFSMQELMNTNFLGIGLGNSIFMLTKPEYYLKSASSLHNLPVQIILETGILGVIIYIFIFIYYLKLMFKKNKLLKDLLFLILIPVYLLGSLSSSVGIFSNYYFFVSLFMSLLVKNNNNKICIGVKHDIK